MVTAYEKMVADMRARIAAAVAAKRKAAAVAAARARAAEVIARLHALRTPPSPTTPPRPSAAPGGPSAPPPSAPAGPTPTELARIREAAKAAAAKVEAVRKAAEEAKRKAEEARRKVELERKRQEALRRAREARERAAKIKEMARRKREQILAKGRAPFVGPPAPTKKVFGPPVPTVFKGLIEKPVPKPRYGRKPAPTPIFGVKPIPTKVKIPVVEPKPTVVKITEKEKGIGISPDRVFPGVGMGAVAEALYKKVDLREPTVPDEVVTTVHVPAEPVLAGFGIPPVDTTPIVDTTPTIPSVLPFDVTPIERTMISRGGIQAQTGIKLYEKRTGKKWGEPTIPKPGEPEFIGPIEPEPEPRTFEEKLRIYGGLRQKVFDVDEEKPGRLTTRIFKRTPEEIAEAHMEKEIIDSLAKNEVTSESISEIAKSYNDNLQQLKDASPDSRWQFEEGGKTYTQAEAVKYLEKNKPEYELKDVKGVGYSYAGKTIDLTEPDAYDDIVDFYTSSQEFVGGVLQERAINQAYKETITANPYLQDLINRYKKIDPNKADEIEHHIRKDIENLYSYTPIEETTDKVVQQLYQQLPESDRIAHDILYTFPHEDTNPIDIIGVPGSYKYFSGVTGTEKTEIVDELFDLYKTDKLPEIMGPGGMGFQRLLAGKISTTDMKGHNQKIRNFRNKLIDQGYGGRTSYKVKGMLGYEEPEYQTWLSEEGKRRLYDYEDKLNDERLKVVIWSTLTDPEYTEKVYKSMGTIGRVAYHVAETAATIFSIPITLPQAVMKLVTGKTIGIDVAEGLESYRYGPRGVWTTLSQEAMSKAGIGAPVSEEEKRLIKDYPVEFMAASLSGAFSFYGLGKATKLIHAPLAARGIKIPSMTGLTRRGVRYMTPRVTKELTRVFGPKWTHAFKSYWPTTMEQISRAHVGKWMPHGLGKGISRRGLAYITKTTRPFTEVITEKVPRTFGRGFRERIVSEVTTPKPTLLGRARMIGVGKRMGIARTPYGDVGYRYYLGREALARQPSALRTGLRRGVSRGWEQFRHDWRIPTYRKAVGRAVAPTRAELERALRTGYRRFTGIERKVGKPLKIAEKKFTVEFPEDKYISTPGRLVTKEFRRKGVKWISEADYKKLEKMLAEGIKTKRFDTVILKNKVIYVDKFGNLRVSSEIGKSILETTTATIKKGIKPHPISLRESVTKGIRGFLHDEASRRGIVPRALPKKIREFVGEEASRRGTLGRYYTTIMKRERPWVSWEDFKAGIKTRREFGEKIPTREIGKIPSRKFRKTLILKESVEEARRYIPTVEKPAGVQYYFGRPQRLVTETMKRIKKVTPKPEVPGVYFPTTLGGEALGLAGRGITYAGLGFGAGLRYRDEIDTTEVTDIEEAQRRLPGIIQEKRVRRITPPVTITERMPVTEQLRGMLPWQVQPQISGLLPMTIQRQKPAFMQEQVLQQQLVTVQPEVDIGLKLHKPKFPWAIEEDELEERRRRKMLQRQQRETGYKEREYQVPDIFGVVKGRRTKMYSPPTMKSKPKMYSPPTMKSKPYKPKTPPRKTKRPKTVEGKKMFFDTSIWEMKPQ